MKRIILKVIAIFALSLAGAGVVALGTAENWLLFARLVIMGVVTLAAVAIADRM